MERKRVIFLILITCICFSVSAYAETTQTSIADKVDIAAGTSVEDIMMKANSYYSMKDFDKAIQLYELALKETNDNNLIAKINLGLSSNYLEKGREAYNNNKDESLLQLAIQCAKKYLETDPYNYNAVVNVAFAYFEMKDWKQAVTYFTEAEIYMDPSLPDVLIIKAARSTAEKNLAAQQ